MEREAKPTAMLSLSDESPEGSAENSSRILDLVKDERGDNPFSHVHLRDIRELAKKYLNEKEQVVVSLYYFDQLSMKEIAKVLSLTESRICQIHSKVIEKLRKALEDLRCDLFLA